MQAIAKRRPIPLRAKVIPFPQLASVTTTVKRRTVPKWLLWFVVGILATILGEIWSSRL